MSVPFKKRMESILRKALWQSGLVLIGAVIWIALFRINDPLALSEAWKIIISVQGIFLAGVALIGGVVSHLLVSKNFLEEELIAFLLIIIAGLTEAWGTGLRPAFLPAFIIAVYALTKIWLHYKAEIRRLKRAYRIDG